jgi:GT2 family glycosyltransferase
MDRIALVVPVLKNFEGFTRLMASVNTDVLPIVIPNYDDNIGVSASWNEGLRRAKEAPVDYVLVVNDDIVLEPMCINTLYIAMRYHPEIDLLTAVNTRDFPEQGSGDPNEPDYSCFMVRPDFTDKFGEFDENFTPAYFEDNDMYYRVELGGGTQRKSLAARMYHSGSVTQNWGGKPFVTSQMFEANRAYYVAKWGGRPGEETYREPFNGLTGLTYKEWRRAA